jgi:SAM-dependent methyltransferase
MLSRYTTYEIARRSLEPFLPPLYRKVRTRLLDEVKKSGLGCSILDVGGRKSPYTIGIPARVVVIDLPRETEVQNTLHLGINNAIVDEVKSRRSNIEDFVFGDMTCSDLASSSFDLVVSVEVLEHVEEDEKFVAEVYRVLKPGGRFLMTTPNGDFVENRNPDHKRHYKRHQLLKLLSEVFESVEVEYAIAGGRYRKLGLRSWSARRPLWTFASAVGNVVNSIQSFRPGIEYQPHGTHHLLATARKG